MSKNQSDLKILPRLEKDNINILRKFQHLRIIFTQSLIQNSFRKDATLKITQNLMEQGFWRKSCSQSEKQKKTHILYFFKI